MLEQDEGAFVIGAARLLTVREETFFHVSCAPTPMAKLDDELDRMIPVLESAKAAAGIAHLGPVLIRYYKTAEPDLYVMEIGIPVPPDIEPAGEARVIRLPALRCAALLYWGSLAHIAEAYGALFAAIEEAGLTAVGDSREWHYNFESDVSPNNVIGLQLEVR